MANSVYLLPAHPPAQPDTLVVFDAFFGAKGAMASTPYTSGPLAAGDYKVIDLAASPTAVEIPLPSTGAAGDRVAVNVVSVPALGATITATGLARSLEVGDVIVVFEWIVDRWAEV